MRHLLASGSVIMLLAWSGCSADRQPGELFGSIEEGVLVVSGTLIVDQALPDLFVRRTADPRDLYDATALGVPDAAVEVTSQGTRWRYSADPDSAGRYLPPTPRPIVTSQTTYRLEVRAGADVATAATTTPGRLELVRTVLLDEKTLAVAAELVPFTAGADSVFSAPQNQLIYRDGIVEMQLARLVDDAVAYQLSLTGLDRESDFVIEADFLEEDDFEDFEREGASPPLEVSEGHVRLPWFAIAFGGRHVLRVFAIDENWYDLIRTNQADGGGFGGLAGDAFERPVFQVEGAIGLFGSAAADSVGIVILPRPGGD
ncbi:MAG: DUF4249 family protein [Gemmatimonadetes bacterium]|nr:DUF4249 family protein [Gemmatimonadota bacterium]MBT7863620.1 DUF4249 family protein [Gemmatimonadota bacterium]